MNHIKREDYVGYVVKYQRYKNVAKVCVHSHGGAPRTKMALKTKSEEI